MPVIAAITKIVDRRMISATKTAFAVARVLLVSVAPQHSRPLRRHPITGTFGCDAFMNTALRRACGACRPRGRPRVLSVPDLFARLGHPHLCERHTQLSDRQRSQGPDLQTTRARCSGCSTPGSRTRAASIIAASGREAIEAADAYKPDVAFVDLVLPPPGPRLRRPDAAWGSPWCW